MTVSADELGEPSRGAGEGGGGSALPCVHGGILTLTLSGLVTRSRLMDSSAEPQHNPVWLLNVGAV